MIDPLEIRDKLSQLADFYQTTRGVGHTTVLKKGTDNHPGALVLVGTHRDRTTLDFDRNTISYSEPDWDHKLLGQHRPLVVDNHAMQMILSDAIRAIDGNNKSLSHYQNEARKYNNQKIFAENKVRELERESQRLREESMGFETQVEEETSKVKALEYCLKNGMEYGSKEYNDYMRSRGMEEFVEECDHISVLYRGDNIMECQVCGLEGYVEWDES